ncbi:LAMI_0G09824g1_1 [Lachancea mirantina]|uniref:rRNA methyltransferase 2, mitochondrial n=1 Tax=Lachancea mirantina TaxID=1230905 RepID=A0A1G4KAE7_9SACH|nr:LAMI_0G09824g1_1 [Lachancea mirantina]
MGFSIIRDGARILARFGFFSGHHVHHTLFLKFGPVRFNSSAKSRWLDRQKNDAFTREAKVLGLRSRAAFKLMEIDDKFRIFKKDSPQCVLDLGYAPGAWSQVAQDRIGHNGMILGVDILPCTPPRGVSAIQANILSKKTHELIRLFFCKHFELYRHDRLHSETGYFHDANENDPSRFQQAQEYREIFSSDEYPNLKVALRNQPLDTILSDMYEPWPQTTGFWNNLTNSAYSRMANTSGLAIRDHVMSMDLCDAALIAAIDLLKPGGSFVSKLYTGEEDELLEKRMKMVFSTVHRYKPQSSRNESKELYFVGLKKRSQVDKLRVFSC